MKKTIIALLSIVTLAACSEKKSETNLHITGNIKGLKKGTLYIQRIVDTALVAIDTINIDGNSNFESDIDLKSPEMLYVFLDRGVTNSIDNNLPFFAEAGKINIDTELSSYFAKAKITGSKNHQLYEQYKKIDSGFSDQLLSLAEAKFEAIKTKNQSELDKIDNLQKAITKRKYLYSVNFALTNSKYEVSPFIALSEISDINLNYLQNIQNALSPKVKESLYGKKLTAYCEELKKS
jgi:hypothetical protein